MRSGGRRQWPAQLRVLSGETRPSQLPPPDAPAPPAAVDPVPPPPGMTAEAARYWAHFEPRLRRLRILTDLDGPSLTNLCRSLVMADKASAVLDGSSILIRDAKGSFKRNPALMVFRDACMLQLRYSQELGLTPSARTLIRTRDSAGIDSPTLADDLDALLR